MSPIKGGPAEFPILRSKNSRDVVTVGLCALPHRDFRPAAIILRTQLRLCVSSIHTLRDMLLIRVTLLTSELGTKDISRHKKTSDDIGTLISL